MAPEDPKPIPADIADLAKEDASEEDKKLAAHLKLCAELAQAGPGAMHRRGVAQPTKPWTPPEKIAFEHPEYGSLKLAIADGKIEKRDPESK